MKQTQIQHVKSRLKETGQVSRNDCLELFISRLGAIISNLKAQGYEFEAYYQKTERGQDYIYEQTNRPKPLKIDIDEHTRTVKLLS